MIENTQQEGTEHTPGLRNEIELNVSEEFFRDAREQSIERLVSALTANSAQHISRSWTQLSGEADADEGSCFARLEAAHATYALNSASAIWRISEGAWLFR